jgi:hypothetical protein
LGIKLHILFLVTIFLNLSAFADEKFLSIKGTVLEEESKTAVTGFSVKVVQDKLDSTTAAFSKSEFQVWAPANRRTTVYFMKEGYVTKLVYIDASYIPSIAFKEKQEIELEILMTPLEKVGRRIFSKPIMTAQYNASANSFSVTVVEQASTSKVSEDYTPPFPAPVDTYKGVQPSANDLALTATFNKEKVKSGSDLSRVIQGILFADMNYCFFNERTNDANSILLKLVEIDPSNWSNLKPVDSPEYGRIVMRTVNREQSVDTLFALGVFVESSRLIFENFTSDTKVLVHLKKLKDVMNAYKPVGLSERQISMVNSLKMMVPTIADLEKRYTESLRNKTDFDLTTDDLFQQLKADNLSIYKGLIE